MGYSAYKSYKELYRIDSEREKVEASVSENEQNVDKLVELTGTVKTLELDVVALKTEFTVELQRHRAKALGIAKEAASAANSFAEALVSNAEAKGASA